MNSKTKKIIINCFAVILGSVGIAAISGGLLLSLNNQKLIVEYKNKTYSSTYINDYEFAEIKLEDIETKIIEIENKIKNKTIKFYNDDKEEIVILSELNPVFNTNEIINNIKNDFNNLSDDEKLKIIRGDKNKIYNLTIDYSEEDLENIINKVIDSFNYKVTEDKLAINQDHNVEFVRGTNGFDINKEEVKNSINNFFFQNKNSFTYSKNNTYSLKIDGKLTLKKESNLNLVNKKISTFSTAFDDYGDRGYNIHLAVNKLSGTLVNPNDVFSYLGRVGPYSCANGYRPSPIQVGTGYAYGCGGGVCQVSTTLYNAQLLAGLQTVERYNHAQAVNYVPKGQDATVGGEWVDYKFKNQYKYPIYIVSYVENSRVVVDIWSNENTLEGKQIVITSNRDATGGYATYMLVYKDKQLISSTLLHVSYYY